MVRTNIDALNNLRGAYNQVVWERDIAVSQLNDLGYSLGEKIDKLSDKQKVSELEDVVASLQCQIEVMHNDIETILLEGENTEIGRKITIERLKEYIFHRK